MKINISISVLILMLFSFATISQSFYYGADLSYANEMDDCGAVYKDNDIEKDVYSIFANHHTNLVRLRLWHTPEWYDNLNNGRRYSDFDDVARSIARSKENGMQVLLDFHLSDSWADPSKQLVPEAWHSVVDDTQLLADSLSNYIGLTLRNLASMNLLPDMVQIGNETNRGILLSPEDNQQWTLDWARNATLFNAAFEAVREVETETDQKIDIMVHLAGPADVEWYVEEFVKNNIKDFDFIGMSYYWSWHAPTTISQTGDVIKNLKEKYPEKEVIVVQTGYIWTLDGNDSANNIINNINIEYGPTTPESQKSWLIDLAQEIISSGGKGMVYWEPAWVSTNCHTLWGQGSHQENATFFDFDGNLLSPGGIDWMSFPYSGLTTAMENHKSDPYSLKISRDSLEIGGLKGNSYYHFRLNTMDGILITQQLVNTASNRIEILKLPPGIYTAILLKKNNQTVLHSQVFTIL